jgi:UPF0755 protein
MTDSENINGASAPQPGPPESAPESPAPAKASARPSAATLRRRRRVTALVVALAGLLLLGGCVAAAGWWLLARPVNDVAAGKPAQVEIGKGAGTKQIADRLADAGVIANPLGFQLAVRLKGADGTLKAGVYDLTTGLDDAAVIEKLQAGPTIKYVTVTIPEGYTVDQIADRVAEKTKIPADEFSRIAKNEAASFGVSSPDRPVRSVEGFLFPKTYRIREDATARDVIAMMVRQFREEVAGVDLSYAKSKNLNLYDVVTIASMVEREAAKADERPIVASVIYNRLARGMRLEIDATIQYILGKQRKRILYRHLRIESPYNTYLHKGLPPGPISNPGLASIEAAANPAQTGYFFYVRTGDDGSHTFATNQADFLKAKKRMKR